MENLDIKTISHLLHCSRRHALDLVLKGQLPAHREGRGRTGKWVVRVDDLPIERVIELKRSKSKWKR